MTNFRVMMKSIPGCCFIFLLLSVLIPKETEAAGLDPNLVKQILKLAKQYGWVIAKKTVYAKCKTKGVPRGIKCPKDVVGIGPSPERAVEATKLYAVMLGNKQCNQFVDTTDCKTGKFTAV